MTQNTHTAAPWRRLSVLGANAAVFLLAWVLVYARDDLWRIRALDGILEALAAGVTLGQFLVLAFYVALNARPTAGRWLHALAIIALASLGYCTIGLAFELRWLLQRWVNPTFALFNQLAFLLALIAVGLLLLVSMRLALWPFRRFLGWRIQWEEEQDVGQMRQFNLAEIFLVTAGVAVSCALGRALFDALLTGPLIGGAILLAAALPTMVAAFVLCSGRSGWRQWGIFLAWAGSITLALSPVVSFAHNELGLLAQSIGRWTTLAPLSLRTIAIAAAYTMAVALAAGFNWRALARLGLRCQVHLRAALPLAADAIGSPARLTPPAAPR